MLECIHDIIFEYKYKGGTIMVYIESPSTNPAFNLALEQYVFDRMDRSQEYFMLWQNDNTVVIGKIRTPLQRSIKRLPMQSISPLSVGFPAAVPYIMIWGI